MSDNPLIESFLRLHEKVGPRPEVLNRYKSNGPVPATPITNANRDETPAVETPKADKPTNGVLSGMKDPLGYFLPSAKKLQEPSSTMDSSPRPQPRPTNLNTGSETESPKYAPNGVPMNAAAKQELMGKARAGTLKVSDETLARQREIDTKAEKDMTVKQVSGDQLAQIGASELSTPKVRNALSDPNRPTAGLATGLKAAAEKTVAPTEKTSIRDDETAPAPAVEKPDASRTVVKGDNLWNMVKKPGMSNADIAKEVDRVAKLNKLTDPNKIQIGQKLNFGEEKELTMSDNPFIKGFFDIEEARAKKTNIFDESKKLTAAQKKHLDKNDNDKIDSEDFKMLRKEETIEEAVKQEHIDKAMKIINDRITKPGAPPKHPSYEEAPEDIKTSAMNLAKNLAKTQKEEVEFSEEEINFINSVMEAMPVAPTSENDSPNPTPKKKAEGSRAKGSMAD